MQGRGVDILSVSTEQYQLCTGMISGDDEGDGAPKPKLTPGATGIPELRQYLFSLPAQTNFRTLHHHVFETLSDIVIRIQRILEKFDEDDDDDYNRMREYLAEGIPTLRETVDSLADSLPADNVMVPWNSNDFKSTIKPSLQDMIHEFQHHIVNYQTFRKLLRENGIPTSGAGLGINMNQRILATMEHFIKNGNTQMQTQADALALPPFAPIEEILNYVKSQLEKVSENAELRRRALAEFDTAKSRIERAHGKLTATLQSTLRSTYLRHTTEVNIASPIATAMKYIYRATIAHQFFQAGKGSYHRQRAYLLKRLTEPFWSSNSSVETMQQKITNTQVDAWKQCCTSFVSEAMSLLDDFALAANELLENNEYLSSDHLQVHEQLEALFPAFKSRLEQVQDLFPRPGARKTAGVSERRKRKAGAKRAATQPPLSVPGRAKRGRIASLAPLERAVSLQPAVVVRKKGKSAGVTRGVFMRDAWGF